MQSIDLQEGTFLIAIDIVILFLLVTCFRTILFLVISFFVVVVVAFGCFLERKQEFFGSPFLPESKIKATSPPCKPAAPPFARAVKIVFTSFLAEAARQKRFLPKGSGRSSQEAEV